MQNAHQADPEVSSQAADRISAFVGEIVGDGDIAPDDDIFALGLVSSMRALDIIQFLEAEFAIVVPLEELELANFATIGAMVKLIGRLTTP